MLGRRVRLLRAAPGPRRLRRDRDRRAPAVGPAPQGRDGRRVLRRHQPAVRRRDTAAEPGRDHAAVGDRQHADDALSRRHPQHGLHALVGQGPRGRRQAGVEDAAARSGRSTASRQATRPASATRRCTPRRSARSPRSGEQLLPAEGRRPAVAGHVRAQDRRAGVPRLPVDRRADRRPLPEAREPLHRHEPQVVHVHERRPPRLARSGHVQPLVRLPADLRRAAGAAAPRQREGGARR